MFKKSEKFTALVALYCVALVVSNIIAGKLWDAPFGLHVTAGVILFPIIYIIGDIMPEVYGLQVTRRIIWLGFIINILMVLVFMATLALEAPGFWKGQEAFVTVLGFTPRLVAASLIAYLVGTNANAWVMVAMKALTNGRWLWTRTIASTIVGETIDSALFILVAFYGVLDFEILPWLIASQVIFKTAYEALATPLTYAAIAWMQHDYVLGKPAATEQ